MKKISNINERILYLIENQYNDNQKKFAESIGYSAQVVFNIVSGRKTNPSYEVLNAILSTNDDISPDWLLTGKGPELRNKNLLNNNKNLIPLYNDVASIGGITELNASIDAVSSTTEYIDAGDWFPGANAAIRHYGDSMIEYPSGSILALKIVLNEQLIFWGKPYSIETTEGRITKKLNKSKIENILIAHSSNIDTYPDGTLIHEPIEIPKDCIVRLYQVLGCVTKEYSNGIVQIINK